MEMSRRRETAGTPQDEGSRTPSIYSLTDDIDEYLERVASEGYEIYPGAEADTFDFPEERNLLYSTTLVESVAHLLKGCMGAGILSIHEGYMFGGLWTALLGTIVYGLLVSHSMLMLVRSAQIMYKRLRVSMLMYPDLAEVSIASGPIVCLRKFGKTFRHLVDITLVLQMIGTCCIYQIIIANTAKQIIKGTYPRFADTINDIRWYLLMVAIPLLLLCLIRNLKYLAPFSLVADIFVVLCTLTTLYYSLRAAGNIEERPAWKDFQGFLKYSGICLYSVDAVGVCLPVENHMREPKYFIWVLQIAMTVAGCLTAVMGFFGYWGWGEDCQSPVTVHLPVDKFTTFIQFLLALMLCVTFAVSFWVPFRLLWHYVGRRQLRNRGLWERLYRMILVLLITTISAIFPKLNVLMIFMGNFFVGLLAFVYPAVIEYLVTWKLKPKKCWFWWRTLKHALMFSLGFFLSFSAIYSVM